eukprot:CAMPEP_0201521494 /NCGR_PEP_ID=MMETSP0161_2-20130828/14455_1 /ASSEMBLY_ACC=CAM_ASM_000251 /TAXON_ID=180227 /ORGANISM="Neoparamoeba aestuarina, Strain SoJaBio B1-5/56/2" /LENGTH=214 /DNA_ID=CAMNT_0047920139 /DNA_START=62 /DNA_END=706 /DNA_ORIENTATION=+
MAKDSIGGGPHAAVICFFFFVLKGLGMIAILALFLKGSRDLYESRIEIVKEYDLGWVFLGLTAINFTTLILFLVNQSFRHTLGLPRPDHQLLKVVENWKKPEDKAIGYAVLDDDGAAGGFNRSGRAALNFGEYLPCLVGFILCAGFVFPFPVFVLCLLQLFGRSLYSIGYSSTPEARFLGFFLSNSSMIMLEMMVLFIGLRSLGLFPSCWENII